MKKGFALAAAIALLFFGDTAHAVNLLTEGFESPFTNGAPPGWTKQFKTGAVDWQRNSGDHNGGGAHTGSYNAMLYYGGSSNHETYLVTPAIDFGSYTTSPTLAFWHKQAPWSLDQDTLKVYYKTSSGGTWTLLASYTSSVSIWTQRTISLPNPGSTYYIGFLGNAKYGYGVCIDDVVVSGSGGGGDGIVTCRAVVCGVEDYMYVNDCLYCDNDARDFRLALLDGTNWQDSNIVVLVDSAATKSAVRNAIQNMANASDADDLCLFFFAGHGTNGDDLSPDDEADILDEYILPVDAIGGVMSTMIRDDELSEWMGAIPTAKIVTILDTCYSGGQIRGLEGAVPEANLRTINLDGLVSQPGDGFADDLVRTLTRDLDDLGRGVVLTACDDDELSQGNGALQNGVFTYCLLQGMAGPADTDGDQQISAEEAFNYDQDTGCTLYYNPSQHPQIYDGYPGELDFLLRGTPPPGITNVTSTASDGCYASGSIIDIQIVYDSAVCVTGTPQLELETGTVDRKANYVSGGGTDTLTFRYSVQSGDTSGDLCYKSTASLTLNGGSITDCAATSANLTLPTLLAFGSLCYNKAIVIDTTPPDSSAGPLDCGYTSCEIDVPFAANDSACGVSQVELWYRMRPLSGGEWGSWTPYGTPTVSPVPFDTADTGGNGEYQFYTIATDEVGNVETVPLEADCSTKVLAGGLSAPVLNSEPARTPGVTNEISWVNSDPLATRYQAECSQDTGFASVDQDTGWQPRPPDRNTFDGLLTGADYCFRVRSGYALCPPAAGTWSQTSQAEFDTDTTSDVSTSSSPGDVVLAGGQSILFSDDFEDGDMVGWVNGPGDYIRQVTNATAAAGTVYSVTLIGGNGNDHSTGISHDLPSLTPSSITFYVRSNSSSLANGYFVVGTGPNITQQAVFFHMDDDGQMGVFDGGTFWSRSYSSLTWYKIRFTFNWTAKKIDYYVDDSLVKSGITFRASVSSLTKLYLYNYHYSQAWWDQIAFTAGSSGYVSAGSIVSTPISPLPLDKWESVTFAKETAPGTALTVDVLDGTTGTPLLGNVPSGTDLSAAGVTASSIKLRANLSTTNSANTPKLSDWAVSFTQTEETVIASDWSNVECSSQLRVCGLTTRYAIMPPDLDWVAFRVWGLVTVLDADSFELDYGARLTNEFSAVPIQVLAPGHGLQTGDYAEATGLLNVKPDPLNVKTNQWTLTCESRLVRRLYKL